MSGGPATAPPEWSNRQTRRSWTSLSVDETPGLFRRLSEEEVREGRKAWPPATCPDSDIDPPYGEGPGEKRGSKGRAASLNLPRRDAGSKPSILNFTWSKGKWIIPRKRSVSYTYFQSTAFKIKQTLIKLLLNPKAVINL